MTCRQRHHVVHDQKSYKTFCALKDLSLEKPTNGSYTVCNSHLSEYGVMGFELGFSMVNPNALGAAAFVLCCGSCLTLLVTQYVGRHSLVTSPTRRSALSTSSSALVCLERTLSLCSSH